MSLKADDVLSLNQSFADLPHRPVLVDLTVEEGQRLKVIYGSCAGFHAIDVDSGNNYDIYIPVHVSWILVGFDLEVFHFLKHRPALNNSLRILKKKIEQNMDEKTFGLDFNCSPSLFYFRKTLCDLKQIQSQVTPHAIVFLPSSDGMEMLLCYEDEGVYVNTYGRIIKDVVLQWGEMPTSVGTSHIHR